MVNISYKVLDILTEDEILLVCKNSDVDIFLKVFRDEKDKNKYKKYVQKLGRIDKKTNMAQTFGPIFAFELYKKGDKSFVSAIATATESLGEKFLQIVSSTNKDITRNLLSAYTDDELIKLYIDVLEKWKGFSSELFFLVLKINGIIIDDFRCRFPHFVHPLHPKHLIFHFERFRDTFLCGKFFNQSKEHIFCLLVQICKITVQLSTCHQLGVNGLVVLLQMSQVTLSPYPDRAFFRLIIAGY